MTSRIEENTLAKFAQSIGPRDPIELLATVIGEVFPGRIAAVSSFGAESVVLLHMISEIDRNLPVIYLDTLKMFPETNAYVETLRDTLGLADLRVQRPDPADTAVLDPRGDLWQSNTDACCHFRKTVPLETALKGFDAWITGRKRFHGGERTELPYVEQVDGRTKVNPLIHFTPDEIDRYVKRHGLPRHPLTEKGYPSIGCMPCTRQALPGEDVRAGRWAESEKTECGIHKAKWFREAQLQNS